MMSEPKPLASLSSMLLARKGQASPAMRRQNMMALNNIDVAEPSALEDLGWNDMGPEDEQDVAHSGGFAGLSPMAPSPVAVVEAVAAVPQSISDAPVPVEAPVPPVVLQQRELVDEFAPEPVAFVPERPVIVEPAPLPPAAIRSAPGMRGKSAFTLRLDAERHLKLRVVCALKHRSAQQIVTDALDAFLATQPVPANLTTLTPPLRGVN